MTSTSTSGHVPSSSCTSSPPHPASGLQGPLSSNPAQPQYVTPEQSLLRSDTTESKISTATTLADGDQDDNNHTPPSPQTPANTRFSSSLSIHSEVAEPKTYAARLPGPRPKNDISSPALPAGHNGVHGNGNSSIQNPARAESAPPLTILWTKSLLTNVPRKSLVKNICSLVGCICGIVSTLTYTYRSYMISLWQAEQAFYDHCREWASQPGELGFDVCSVVLQEALRQPPYVRSPITVKHLKRDLPETQPVKLFRTRDSDEFFFYLISLFVLLVIVYAIIVLCRFGCRRWRRAPTWDSNTFWPPHQGPHQPTDAFSSVNVRIPPPGVSTMVEHFNSTTNTGWMNTSTEEKHLANISHKRRLISVVSESSCEEPHTTSIRRVSPVSAEQPLERVSTIYSKDLTRIPLDPASTQDETTNQFRTVSIKTKRRPLTQVGDALKGRCDNERVSPFPDSEDLFRFLRRKVDSKSRKLSARLRRPG